MRQSQEAHNKTFVSSDQELPDTSVQGLGML